MEEAYQKLLQRKREIERKYRAQTGDFTTPNSKVSLLDNTRINISTCSDIDINMKLLHIMV